MKGTHTYANMEGPTDCNKLTRLNKLKCTLHEIEKKMPALSKIFDWDYNKLLLEGDSSMLNSCFVRQHRSLERKLKPHKRKTYLGNQGYDDVDKIFPEYSRSDSCISLCSELINSITKNNASAVEKKSVRSDPESLTNFDVNFSRDEKLAIYDYVIANTKKQATFSDLLTQAAEKKQERKEMTGWELAAAERDAKRRRASYRNKVHTSCKTHTEILREVIKEQMDMLKEDTDSEKWNEERKRHEKCNVEDKKNCNNPSKWRNEEVDRNRKHYNGDYLSKNYPNKYWRETSKSDPGSKSRNCDKHRKWNSGEGRRLFHKSRYVRPGVKEIWEYINTYTIRISSSPEV